MEIPRLVAVLLMVLEWTHSGLPSPLRPICDRLVLDRFIKEAQDMEVTMSCSEGCILAEPLSVPQTSVDFAVWEKEDAQMQAREVQSGLWLLSKAISVVRASVTSTMLQNQLDNSHSNILSIRHMIRRLNFQEYIPPTDGTVHEETWNVSSMPELLRVHTYFLRGKVRLLLDSAAVCRRGGS